MNYSNIEISYINVDTNPTIKHYLETNSYKTANNTFDVKLKDNTHPRNAEEEIMKVVKRNPILKYPFVYQLEDDNNNNWTFLIPIKTSLEIINDDQQHIKLADFNRQINRVPATFHPKNFIVVKVFSSYKTSKKMSGIYDMIYVHGHGFTTFELFNLYCDKFNLATKFIKDGSALPQDSDFKEATEIVKKYKENIFAKMFNVQNFNEIVLRICSAKFGDNIKIKEHGEVDTANIKRYFVDKDTLDLWKSNNHNKKLSSFVLMDNYDHYFEVEANIDD